MIDEKAADVLKQMMKDNVTNNYGAGRFSGLDVGAKSGTAQRGGDAKNNAWFVGFVDNGDTPFAFAVVVEDSGSGTSAAGSVAARVLQSAVNAAK